ncbi:MAG: hypothetical protein R3F11_13060 [Verrucomicrobiales bacterium]
MSSPARLELPFGDLPKCWERIVAGSAREIDLWAVTTGSSCSSPGLGSTPPSSKTRRGRRKKSLGPLSYMVSAFQRLGKESAPLRIEVPGEDPREEPPCSSATVSAMASAQALPPSLARRRSHRCPHPPPR